jgi:drug/metabolite transporter (DMT)-like permease
MALIQSGVWAAIGAAALFGMSTPLAKMLLGDVSPLLLAGLLYTGSGLGLALILLIRTLIGGATNTIRPQGKAIFWLLAAALFGGALGPFLLMRGLVQTDSASASLILNFEGVFTALLAWFIFKENFDRRILFGMVLIVLGGIVLSAEPSARASGILGPALIASACLAWAIDNNLTRKVSISDAMLIACTKGLVAGPGIVALAVHFGAPMPTAAAFFAAGLLGFLGYGLSLTLFVIALRNLGTARTGAYFSLAPFIGATLAVLLGAPLSAPLVIAGCCMALGVWLHLTEHHIHPHRHTRIEHEHAHMHDAHHQHLHSPPWDGRQPHAHVHVHEPLEHTHAHFPDVHHRHEHTEELVEERQSEPRRGA